MAGRRSAVAEDCQITTEANRPASGGTWTVQQSSWNVGVKDNRWCMHDVPISSVC